MKGWDSGRDGVDLRAFATVSGLTAGRPGETVRIHCPVWAGVGLDDPITSPAQRDACTAEMQDAGVDWRLVAYGAAYTLSTRSELGWTSSTCSPSACP